VAANPWSLAIERATRLFPFLRGETGEGRRWIGRSITLRLLRFDAPAASPMKRPLLLVLALGVVAALLLVLLRVVSNDTGSAAADPGISAGSSTADASPPASDSDPVDRAAELASPATATVVRAEAPADSASSSAPRATIEGRVVGPAGCAFDETAEVFALRSESDLDGALRAAKTKARARFRAENPFESAGRVELPSANGRLVGRGRVEPDGRYRIEIDASLEQAHVIVVGRSWYGLATEEVELTDAPKRTDLVALCGAWIEGVATVPAGSDPAQIEGLELELTTRVESITGDMRFFRGVDREGYVNEGRFEFRALDPTQTFTVKGTPARLAAASVDALDLAPARGKAVELSFPAGGIVRGSVQGTDGTPVAGAEVSAKKKGRMFGFDDEAVRITQSNADGSFELPGVAAGAAELHAQLDGMLLGKTAKVEIVDGGVLEGVVLVLGKGASISGVVRWADGTAATSIEVNVTFDMTQMGGMGAFNALKGGKGSSKSDSEGRFSVSGLGAGPFSVEARALPETEREALKAGDFVARREREHVGRANTVKPGTSGLELVLRAPTGVKGRVVDMSGAPIAKFTIRAHGVGEGMLAELGQESKDESFEHANGEFLLPGLHTGKWKLHASADGFSDSTPIEFAMPIEPGADPLAISMERAAVVRGVVRAPDGSLVAEATVRVDDGSPEWMRAVSSTKLPETKTDAEGKFELTGIRPGATAVRAKHESHASSASLPIDLSAGQIVTDIVLTLTNGGRITGEVFHEGKPAVGMMIQVQDMKVFSQHMTTTDAKGRFEAAHLDPGGYQIVAIPTRGDALISEEGEFDASSMLSNMKMATADVVEGSDVHVVLGAAPEDPVRVTGRVTMAGAPVASATVMFLPEGGKKGLSGFKPVQTKKDGTFAVTLDGPGGYSVSVQRMNALMNEQSVHEERRVVPKSEDFTIDIVLPEGRISGRVTGVDGKPAGNARISIVREGTGKPGTIWGGQFHELRTNVDGDYDATGLPAGTYTVMAGGSELGGMLGDSSAIGGREMQSSVEIGERDWRRGIDFRLKVAATVEITVVDESDRAVSGAVVFARDEAGRAVDVFSFVTTDGTGRAKYGGLSAGRYTFRARTSTISSGDSVAIRVEEGGKSAVKLVLEKGTLILVKIVDSEKKPVVASVQVLDENGRDLASQLGLQEIMERFQGGDFDPGEQKFGPFPAGKYRVRVTSESGKTATKPVTLSGQAERKVTIEIE